jgi:hypothetical protein
VISSAQTQHRLNIFSSGLFMKKLLPLLALSLFLSNPTHAATTNGYIEKVMLLPDHITLEAKLDTGAATSSLNVRNIKLFKKQNQTWVAFDIYNKTTRVKHATYPLLKMISIKNRASETTGASVDKRPLISMQVCLGHAASNIEVNLMDRKNFAYPFLLGRQAMHKFNVAINPGKKYLNPLNCP